MGGGLASIEPRGGLCHLPRVGEPAAKPGTGQLVNYARRSARIIVVDEEFRVLLFRFYFDPKKRHEGHVWITPGGGVDKGEALVDATTSFW